MSRKTFIEALEGVLCRERELRDDMMILRPAAKRMITADARDIALPDLGEASFSVAVGVAMCGMRPVLDLRRSPDATAILLDAVYAMTPGFLPDMTVLTGAEDAETLMELPGLRVFFPKTPRQAAGFARAAVRSERICLLIVDDGLADLEDEVPDEDDFMLMPLSAADPENEPEGDEAAEKDEAEGADSEEDSPAEAMGEADERAGEAEDTGDSAPGAPDEEAGDQVEPAACEEEDGGIGENAPEEYADKEGALFCEPGMNDEPAASSDGRAVAEDAPAPVVRPFRQAMRSVPWSPDRLRALAKELEMEEERLAARCMERVARGRFFEWTYEADSLSGECAFLPGADGTAHLWIGCDMLCLTWDASVQTTEGAAGILRAARRMLEKPTLLIYDKEDEEI